MKKDLNVLIIGAGGVASYMLPALRRSFNLSGVIFDGDILEERNLDRQLFDKKDIGDSKAGSLIKLNKLDEVKYLPEYFHEESWEDHESLLHRADIQLMICLVDNHPARKAALQSADERQIPCLIAANEYATSQVMYYLPSWKDTPLDPRVKYPEILTADRGDPLGCQGEEAIEATPQLAIANQVAASLGNLMIYLWHDKFSNITLAESMEFLPIEYQTNYSKLETETVKEANERRSTVHH